MFADNSSFTANPFDEAMRRKAFEQAMAQTAMPDQGTLASYMPDFTPGDAAMGSPSVASNTPASVTGNGGAPPPEMAAQASDQTQMLMATDPTASAQPRGLDRMQQYVRKGPAGQRLDQLNASGPQYPDSDEHIGFGGRLLHGLKTGALGALMTGNPIAGFGIGLAAGTINPKFYHNLKFHNIDQPRTEHAAAVESQMQNDELKRIGEVAGLTGINPVTEQPTMNFELRRAQAEARSQQLENQLVHFQTMEKLGMMNADMKAQQVQVQQELAQIKAELAKAQAEYLKKRGNAAETNAATGVKRVAEQGRHNKVTEGIGQQNAASNRLRANTGVGGLDERKRHNQVTEGQDDTRNDQGQQRIDQNAMKLTKGEETEIRDAGNPLLYPPGTAPEYIAQKQEEKRQEITARKQQALPKHAAAPSTQDRQAVYEKKLRQAQGSPNWSKMSSEQQQAVIARLKQSLGL